jgi:protein-S-isoprenylcysteine O-methyltransferase Ste14
VKEKSITQKAMLFFCFYNIPKLDAYLKEKYKDEFIGYAGRTKKFIPFLL